MSLNPDQLQAVECDNHCLVVACPGSGKTHLVIEKIIRILQSDPAAKLVVLCFTKDGAKELTERVHKRLGNVGDRCYISTFHALALLHLKREKVNVRIAKNAEIKDFVVRAIAAAEVQIDEETALKKIEQCKTIPHYEPMNDAEGKLYQAYLDICQRNHVMDFYDVMLLSLKKIRDGSLPILGATHFIVDEGQDIDEVQYQYMMEHYRRGDITVTMVGDDDQTIFKFRHALGYDGMCRFEKETKATRVTLGINYRCHREILNPADRLISRNRNRMEKRLYAQKGPGGKIEALRFGDSDKECEEIAKVIASTLDKEIVNGVEVLKVRKQQWAVLARNNRLLDSIDALFGKERIPFYKNGASFWDYKVPSLILTFLSSLCNMQRNGIEQTLHWAGVQPDELDKLHLMLHDDFANIYSKDVKEMINLAEFSPESAAIITSFLDKLPGWVKSVRKGTEDRNNLAINGFLKWLSIYAEKYEMKNINIAHSALSNISGSLLVAINNIQRKNETNDGCGVALTTMHSSKGLEFDNVWILGAEEKIIPDGDGGIVSNDVLEEERKLMYVAMTRARNRLIISSTSGAGNQPSRFIAEALNP